MFETARLQLRPMTRDEAEHILSGDRAGRHWSTGYPRTDDQDIARVFLGAPDTEPLFGPLQIVLQSSGVVIGCVGFFGPPDEQGTVEFGYGVAPEVEGRGYATEAVRALLHHAFTTGRVRHARADTAHDNLASQRVLEKAGLRRTSSDENLHYYECTAVSSATA
ncbi:GNAT family N-acetyltransferase [Streptomyces cellulosae]|uniref:GNAT family N-acetyltransferase n=1 Tax=Streptomyces cellulosae TaxID=1968 RepID=A0ABW7YCJ7_STRCE